MTVTLPMELDLSVKRSSLNEVKEELLLEALQQVLIDECPTNRSNVKGCVVDLVHRHESSTTSRRRRLSHGDIEDLAVEFKMIIDVVCGSSACTEANDLANDLYNQVTNHLIAAIEDGTLESNLQEISGGISSLLEAVIESGHVEDAEVSISEEHGDSEPDSNSDWYPDFSGGANVCKADGRAPMYMKMSGTFFEASIEACCERFFSWDYYVCTGIEVRGFYPDWGESETCIDVVDTMPDYMRNNPEHWLFDDIEGCCNRHYGYDYARCVRSGGI